MYLLKYYLRINIWFIELSLITSYLIKYNIFHYYHSIEHSLDKNYKIFSKLSLLIVSCLLINIITYSLQYNERIYFYIYPKIIKIMNVYNFSQLILTNSCVYIF